MTQKYLACTSQSARFSSSEPPHRRTAAPPEQLIAATLGCGRHTLATAAAALSFYYDEVDYQLLYDVLTFELFQRLHTQRLCPCPCLPVYRRSLPTRRVPRPPPQKISERDKLGIIAAGLEPGNPPPVTTSQPRAAATGQPAREI